MNLNPSQLRAVASTARTVAVVCGPGGGKTTVLVERIKARPSTSKVVITFTNAGAVELKKRLEDIQLEYIGTLHGFCFRLLNRHGILLGYRAGGVNLLGAEDAEALLLACAKYLGWKGSRVALKFKANHGVEMIHKEYAHRLRRNNLVDYDTVLDAGLALLQRSEVAEAVAVDELLVDESQDGSEIDWLIYKHFPAGSKFFVGDPDQSIFAFRGAKPEMFVSACRAEFWD